MARRRLGVALLVPPPVRDEVDGLRRACGDGALDRITPHVTLVPPVNVRADDVSAALAALRDAAAESRPLRLTLGPPTTFLPDSPTLYLRVGGDESALARLHELRHRVFVPPLERSLTWPFVPHVTLADEMAPHRIEAALAALGDYEREVVIDRVHLLEEARHHATPRWHPVADYPLRPRTIVGRGGLPLELTVSELVDPEALVFEAGQPDAPLVPERPARTDPLVAVARRHGDVVGVAHGWTDGATAEVMTVTVSREHRRQGIARHLGTALRAWTG